MSDEQLRIFQEVPDDIDETWTHVAVLGGMVDRAYRLYDVARNFKEAGDILIENGLHVTPANDLIYPILYNYRHAIELYLKAIVVPTKRNHNISKLFVELEQMLQVKHHSDIPKWFVECINEFIQYDDGSTTFRYPDESVSDVEKMIDLPKLKKTMDIIAEIFHRIMLAENNANK